MRMFKATSTHFKVLGHNWWNNLLLYNFGTKIEESQRSETKHAKFQKIEKIRSPTTQKLGEIIDLCTLQLLDLTSSASSFDPMLQINQDSSDFSYTTTFAREVGRARKAEKSARSGVLDWKEGPQKLWALFAAHSVTPQRGTMWLCMSMAVVLLAHIKDGVTVSGGHHESTNKN